MLLVVITVLMAFAFDFVNGINDAANSIATIVSTRVLSPRLAVVWAAFFNFAALFIFGTSVASTVGSGIVSTSVVNDHLGPYMILGALCGAIVWAYFFCARIGIPVSSSHSLIGGLIGAALVKGGISMLILGHSPMEFVHTKIFITFLFIVLAPVLGLVMGYLIMVITTWIARYYTPQKVDKVFRIGQLISSACFSIGHGGNDAQKTMGVIAMLLYSARSIPFVHDYLFTFQNVKPGIMPVPHWVEVTALTVIALGTLSGGMKIVKTMGMKLTHLKPVGGFSAEVAGAITLFSATHFGIPVSTTQTIAGAIMGVGSTRRVSAVRWGIAGNIIWTWILTIPCSAILGAIAYFIISLFIK